MDHSTSTILYHQAAWLPKSVVRRFGSSVFTHAHTASTHHTSHIGSACDTYSTYVINSLAFADEFRFRDAMAGPPHSPTAPPPHAPSTPAARPRGPSYNDRPAGQSLLEGRRDEVKQQQEGNLSRGQPLRRCFLPCFGNCRISSCRYERDEILNADSTPDGYCLCLCGNG